MSEELDVLMLVADRLDAARIPYMVSGSMAMNVYAEPRLTRDIDIVVEIRSADIEAIVAAFEQESIVSIAIMTRTMRW
jgi:hypothetical protein